MTDQMHSHKRQPVLQLSESILELSGGFHHLGVFIGVDLVYGVAVGGQVLEECQLLLQLLDLDLLC
jgi:hypothetical protein